MWRECAIAGDGLVGMSFLYLRLFGGEDESTFVVLTQHPGIRLLFFSLGSDLIWSFH